MNKLIQLGAAVAPYFIALPMAVYGYQHFLYLKFVALFIPEWIPFRTFWAAFTGVCLITAAISIVIRKWDRSAATMLGVMIFIWVVFLHTSRIAAQPGSPDEWRGFFQALSMSAISFVLAASISKENSTANTINKICTLGYRFSPQAISLSMVALGILHFVFPETITPKVPIWFPKNVMATYLSGAALILTGAAILFKKTSVVACATLGVLIFLSMLFIHLPVVLSSPNFESDWCKTFVMSGGLFLL
ncbi:MAG: DoxX, partial [Verrucomicrobiales bacterium]|nr:DoxX [Verrucomicrobiales bacterium]